VGAASAARLTEPGADQVAVGVCKLVEDGEGALPGLARSGVVADGLVRVTEVGQGARLLVPVTEIPIQIECAAVAGDGPCVVTKIVVDQAEAVPGPGLPVAVAELLVQGQGPLAGHQAALMLAEQRVTPADVVEGERLPGPVAGGLVQPKCLLGVVQGLCVAAGPDKGRTQIEVDVSVPDPVTGLVVRLEGVLELDGGIVAAAELVVGPAEAAAGDGLRRPVAEPSGGGQREPPGGGPVPPVPLPVEKGGESPGQLPAARCGCPGWSRC
jgi:hypothetical protein